MKKVIVLGAGLVGKAIALDLGKDYKVTAADYNTEVLKPLKQSGIKTVKADFSKKKSLKSLIEKYDLVIGAVPGFMGYKTLETIIEAGKNVVDISFFPEDPIHLNKLAQQKGITAIVDCGVAPGLSNIILGYHHQRMNVQSFKCYVGGLPKERIPPFEYKAPFSPIDVIEEYTRPARIMVDEKEVVKEALSEIEILNFKKVGKLEAFNSDGLRTLLHTIDVPNMIEKTLRYPGHAEKMKLLRDVGLLSSEKLKVNGKSLRPIDLTTSLLFPLWQLEPQEKEFTIMRIIIEGTQQSKPKRIQYDIYDEFDVKTGISSMARTTGYTCTATARLVLEGDYDQKGISPPEFVGAREECFEFVKDYLIKKGIEIKL